MSRGIPCRPCWQTTTGRRCPSSRSNTTSASSPLPNASRGSQSPAARDVTRIDSDHAAAAGHLLKAGEDPRLAGRAREGLAYLGALDDLAVEASGWSRLWKGIGVLSLVYGVLLLIPIGTLVIVLMRNIVGIRTFGTFLPALIAGAASATGALWGVVGLLLVVLAVMAVRDRTDAKRLGGIDHRAAA